MNRLFLHIFEFFCVFHRCVEFLEVYAVFAEFRIVELGLEEEFVGHEIIFIIVGNLGEDGFH